MRAHHLAENGSASIYFLNLLKSTSNIHYMAKQTISFDQSANCNKKEQ
jgi:hypothetical protein